jgi:hypothetical protein
MQAITENTPPNNVYTASNATAAIGKQRGKKKVAIKVLLSSLKTGKVYIQQE